MEGVRETAVGSPGGRHETITLQAETRTPRARTLSASFVRERTPLGELPPARRQRKKNEGKGRARALGRLDPLKHEQYLEAERTRKKDAALRAARGEQVVRRTGKRSAMALDAAWGDVDGSLTTAGLPSSPAWKSRRASVWRRSFRRPNSAKMSVQQQGRNFVSGALLLLQARAVDHVRRALSSSDLEGQR